jgi:hypothetical protein
MADYQRKNIKMNPVGMSLAYPPDLMPDGLFPFLQNTRFDRNGAIKKRNKLNIVKDLSSAATGNVYLIRRLRYGANDSRLIHIGNKLLLHNLVSDALSVLDTNFVAAQNTTSIVGIRPEESINPYLYIANTNRFRKFSSDGDYVEVGITAPNSPCVAKIASNVEKIIDEIDGTGYTNGGAAGVTVVVNRIPNTTTITSFVFDVGASGWVSIVPATFPAALQPKTILLLNDATIPVSEQIIVDDVIPAYLSVGVATIASIKYDSGTTGDCTIQLSVTPEDLQENAILLLGGTEYVRVKAVIDSVSQGKSAIRVSTVGTFSAGTTVSGKASLRAYTQNIGYTITNSTLSTDAMKIPFAAAGIGYAQKIVNIDLSRISNRAIGENDILRMAILLSDTSALDEGQIQLDVSQTGGTFTNYLFYPFTPSSLTQSYKQTAASTLAQQQLIQRIQLRQQIIGRVGSRFADVGGRVDVIESGIDIEDIANFNISGIDVPNELSLGDSQWSVLEIPISQLLQNRVGTDASRTLKDITAIRFSFKANAVLDAYVDSFSIGGTYELDSFLSNEGVINNYFWTYRYRSSKTRAVSAFAPPNRNGLFVSRGRGELTFTASLDAQVDKIDIYRFGGRLTDFYYIGTKENSSSTFFDELPDANAIKNPVADFNYYKPFTILDKSRKGVCDIIGTEVSFVSGDNFNTAWSRGSQIIIDGVSNALYNSPSSTTKLTLNKSVGNLVGVTFYLPAPRLVGQTLPTIFGPFGEGNLGLIVFGLGNTNAQGTIYWLDGNSPDTMHDINSLEITSPDEPLIDGCIYRKVPYVFTNRRAFSLSPRITNDGQLTFYAEEVEGFRGVRSKGCITVLDAMYFVANDGVYKFDGGNVSLISYDLYPLFPTDSVNNQQWFLGNSGLLINGILTSSIVTLTGYRNYLYLFCDGLVYVYDLTRDKFISRDSSSFSLVSILGDESQYVDELVLGGISEYYKFTSLKSGIGVEINFTSKIYTPSLDFGDTRILKEFFEATIDYEPNSLTVTPHVGIAAYLDNYYIPILLVSPNITAGSPNREKALIEYSDVVKGVNISFELTLLSELVKIYEIEPAYLPAKEKIKHRYTDWSNGGFGGSKVLKELIVDADTFGQDVELDLEGDGGVLIETITINSNVRKRVAYSIPDNYTTLFRIRQHDTNKDWLLYDVDIRFEEAPDSILTASIWLDELPFRKKFLQRIIVDADTNGGDVIANIETDENIVVVSNIVLNHNGRGQKSYDFPPVIGYLFRLVPQSAVRIFKIDWKYDIEPEGQKIWRTQPTTHDISGYQFIRESVLAIKSTTDVLYSVIIDGVPYNYLIDSTDGSYKKIQVSMKAIKGQIFEYKIVSSEEVILVQKDCEIHVHSINGGDEQIKNPFGHLSREIGTA